MLNDFILGNDSYLSLIKVRSLNLMVIRIVFAICLYLLRKIHLTLTLLILNDIIKQNFNRSLT